MVGEILQIILFYWVMTHILYKNNLDLPLTQ